MSTSERSLTGACTMAPSSLIKGTVQLNLDVGVYGREKELETLLDILQRISSKNDGIEGIDGEVSRRGGLVLIGGEAGIGKSCLVRSLRDPTVDQYGGHFAVGKCEGGTPHAALTDAFDRLCDSILSDQMQADSIRKLLSDNEEITDILLPIVPKLRSFCSRSACDDGEPLKVVDGYFHSSDQILYALKALIQKVAEDRLLVLVVEDLHWADDSTLELIFNLANDPASSEKNFILVGTYRDNEGHVDVNQTSWSKLLTKPMEHFKLDTLGVDSINRIISAATDMKSSDETLRLAAVLHDRSGGVPFYVLQLIQKLFEKDLIRYCFQTCQWKWNLSDIEAQTKISNKLADIVVGRIDTLTQDLQRFLKVGSNLGSTFAPEIVGQFLLDNEMAPSNTSIEPALDDPTRHRDDTVFHGCADALVGVGLIRRVSNERYQFCHDRIQECANDVHVGIKEEVFHYRLGQFLINCDKLKDGSFSTKDSERLFFVAVNQMNLGLVKMKGDDEKVELARLNLKASELARKKSSFFPAARYALKGINCLHDLDVEFWTDHYKLSLELHKQAAEMLACSGKEKVSNEIAGEIIDKAISNEDKMPAYFCRVNTAGRSGDLERAVTDGLEVLTVLGERFPSRQASIFSIIRGFIKTKKCLKGWSDEQILNLPEAKDKRIISVMGMMSIVTYYAAYASKRLQSFIPVMYLRMTCLTIKYGMSPFSSIALSGYGMLSCFSGNVDEGYRFGRLSVKLAEKCKSMRHTIARVNAIFHSFLSFRKEPLQDGLEPLLKAYRTGMETGDILSALTCAGAYCAQYLHSGLPLGALAQDYRDYLNVMETYNQGMLRLINGITAQFVFNLIGESEDPLILNGEALNRETFFSECDKFPHNDVARWIDIHLNALIAFFFEQHSRAWALLKEAKKLESNISIASVFASFVSHYFIGSSGLKLWKQSKKEKYKKAAKKSLKALDKLVRSGCTGCFPMFLLLKAEMLGCKKGSSADDVIAAFDHAVSVSAKTGSLQFRAIALEKAGIYLIDQGDPDGAAESYIRQAVESFNLWGANAKVDALKKKHKFLSRLELQGNRSHGRSLRGRTRFDASATQKHHRLSETSHRLSEISR